MQHGGTGKKYTKSTAWLETRLTERDICMNNAIYINSIQIFIGLKEAIYSGRNRRVYACHHVGGL